ncbi:MAG: hypothetical protein GVY24_07550 [Planctomycetes bacterium]|jgi:hypothetical protein|nr:hypothetical protein [Planctomycetota bacterium]
MKVQAHKRQGGCVLGCLSLLTPRVIIILMVIFSDYLGDAFAHWVWPLLGFLFMPITTIAAAVAYHELPGSGLPPVSDWGLIVLGVILDLGLIGGGSWGLKRPSRRRQ